MPAVYHNLITEEEARERWCPFARVIAMTVEGGTASANRPFSDPEHRLACLASRCMAWRWWTRNEGGYCGLAGPPEVG